MKHVFATRLAVLCAALLLLCAPAQAGMQMGGSSDAGSVEDDFINAMIVFCVTPVTLKMSAATVASDYDLQELPPERAEVFTRGMGRAFAIPGHVGNAVLIAYDTGVCSVAVREVDNKKFWRSADAWIEKKTPFSEIGERTLKDGSLQKSYQAQVQGRIGMIVSASPQFNENGMQALMTVSRVKDKTK